MTNELFVDSSAIYALTDKDDEAGPRIELYLKEKRPQLVTTDFVFAESLSLITRRLGKKVGVQAGDQLQKSRFLRLVHLDIKTWEEGWDLYRKYKDKDFDFIDATSFVFCKKQGIKDVITLDHHFSQVGFQIVP